jgi:hypothetical protein
LSKHDLPKTAERSPLSRRALIGGGAAALGASLALPACAPQPARWDHETDILAVGSGAAGLSAAIFAKGKGQRAMVVEKMPIIGGTTAKSGGGHWIPNNFVLRELGVDDRREDCLQFMARAAWPDHYSATAPGLGIPASALALLEAFYDNGWRAVDRLLELKAYRAGLWFLSTAVPQLGPNQVPDSLARVVPDYFDHAIENKVPRGRTLMCQDDQGRLVPGSGMIAMFEAWLTAQQVPMVVDHRVRHLTTDGSGHVTGVIAEHEGREVRIRATRGVIFGTGGYAHNPEIINRFQRNRIFGSCAAPGATGDIIAIAGEANAMLGNMTSVWGASVILEDSLDGKPLATTVMGTAGDSMILVNRDGARAVDELRTYNSRTRVHGDYDSFNELYPNKFLFMIFDERTRTVYGGNYPIPGVQDNPPWLMQAATLEELTRTLSARLDALAPQVGEVKLREDFTARLKQTIERFNGFARRGVDEDFGRGNAGCDRASFSISSRPRPDVPHEPNPSPNPTMYPIAGKGPYYAIILARGALDTNGGPVINGNGQICNQQGEPIAGLYGAGNCIASPTREAYFGGGGTIGPALAFAHAAVEHACNTT